MFNASPVIANEVPGGRLALESEDDSSHRAGGVEVRTGFPGDKRKRFAVWNNLSDIDTGTIRPDDKAFFEALSTVDIYGAEFRLWNKEDRGSSGGVWLQMAYNSAGFGRLNSTVGDPLVLQIGGNATFVIKDGRARAEDDQSVIKYAIWSSPPDPKTGDEAIQDGSGWNPAGTDQEEKMCYLNGSWTQVS